MTSAMKQGMRTTILLISLFATLSCANTTDNHTSAKDGGAKDVIVQNTEKKKIDGTTIGALAAYVLLEGLIQHGLGLLIECAIN